MEESSKNKLNESLTPRKYKRFSKIKNALKIAAMFKREYFRMNTRRRSHIAANQKSERLYFKIIDNIYLNQKKSSSKKAKKMFSKIRKSPLGKIESRLDHNSKGLKELSVNVQLQQNKFTDYLQFDEDEETANLRKLRQIKQDFKSFYKYKRNGSLLDERNYAKQKQSKDIIMCTERIK